MYLFFNSSSNRIEYRDEYPGYLYCNESVMLVPVESGLTCTTLPLSLIILAGVAGLEPTSSLLESEAQPLYHTPGER